MRKKEEKEKKTLVLLPLKSVRFLTLSSCATKDRKYYKCSQCMTSLIRVSQLVPEALPQSHAQKCGMASVKITPINLTEKHFSEINVIKCALFMDYDNMPEIPQLNPGHKFKAFPSEKGLNSFYKKRFFKTKKGNVPIIIIICFECNEKIYEYDYIYDINKTFEENCELCEGKKLIKNGKHKADCSVGQYGIEKDTKIFSPPQVCYCYVFPFLINKGCRGFKGNFWNFFPPLFIDVLTEESDAELLKNVKSILSSYEANITNEKGDVLMSEEPGKKGNQQLKEHLINVYDQISPFFASDINKAIGSHYQLLSEGSNLVLMTEEQRNEAKNLLNVKFVDPEKSKIEEEDEDKTIYYNQSDFEDDGVALGKKRLEPESNEKKEKNSGAIFIEEFIKTSKMSAQLKSDLKKEQKKEDQNGTKKEYLIRIEKNDSCDEDKGLSQPTGLSEEAHNTLPEMHKSLDRTCTEININEYEEGCLAKKNKKRMNNYSDSVYEILSIGVFNKKISPKVIEKRIIDEYKANSAEYEMKLGESVIEYTKKLKNGVIHPCIREIETFTNIYKCVIFSYFINSSNKRVRTLIHKKDNFYLSEADDYHSIKKFSIFIQKKNDVFKFFVLSLEKESEYLAPNDEWL